MKRPQSAKMGLRGYWGHSNTDEVSEHNTSTKNLSKKQVVIMKPDLTSHDFSRILPKKIHQDKERLYSETLQLKQSLNEVMEENIRLKTKISILQKQKSRMGKFLENAPDMNTRKSNSRLNIYASKVSEKQNNIIQNLKKMVRQAKEEVEYLKSQNMKIKKTIKYTKINEMEIEKKILFDQNKRINQMLEDITQQFNDQNELERQNNELKKYLEDQMQENKLLSEQNQKYQAIVQELQNKIKTQVDKYQNKQKKLSKDLAIEKRKVQQSHRYIEDLRKEITQLRKAQTQSQKIKSKPLVRPTSSVPNKRYNHSQAIMKKQPTNQNIQKTEEYFPNDDLGRSETEQIKIKNTQLQQQLKQIRSKLEKSENQLKLRTQIPKEDKQNIIKQQRQKSFKKKEYEVQQQQQQQQIKQQSQKNIAEIKNEPIVSNVQQKQSPKKVQEQSYNEAFEKEDNEQHYDEQFEKVDQSKQSRLQQQIQKVKQEFQQNQQQEQIYKKQDLNKNIKNKNPHKKKRKQQQKTVSASKKDYKPDKKILSQIKQLLTYRMKSQRYPYADLKADIQSAETSSFTYADLCDMFINEPFHLTAGYAKALLSYCYESEVVDQNELLKGEVLIAKLRKVIQDFELMDEQEQKQMIIRISEMTCTYPQQLEAAFEDIKNGEQTVSKNKLIEMFEKLQLERKYIELIIAELSLCSDDLQHLNFHGFFQRFYIQQNDPQNYNQNHPIQQQGQQSQQSYRDLNKKKKSTKNMKKNTEDEDEDYSMGKYMMAIDSRVPDKQKKYDDEDIVSDDGRI